jgi:hypothetical protein
MKVRKAHSISHFSLARQVGSTTDGSRGAMLGANKTNHVSQENKEYQQIAASNKGRED